MVSRVSTRLKIDERRLGLEVEKLVNKRFLEADFTEQVNEQRKKASAVARGYYAGMLEGVGDLLEDPGGGPFRTGGVHSRQVTTSLYKANPAVMPPSEAATVTSAGSWNALNPEYIEQHPRSTTFWRKTGILAKLFDSERRAAMPTLTALNRYSSARVAPLTAATKSGAPARKTFFRLQFPPLHPAIDKILRESFIRAKAMRQQPPSRYDPILEFTLYRILPPEWKRPWLAKYAAEMGKRFRDCLRNL